MTVVEPVTKDNGTQQLASVLEQAMSSTEGVLRELLRASAASPIIAGATVIILADILQTKGMISKEAASNLAIFTGALTTVDVVGGLFKSGVSTLAYGTEQVLPVK